MKVAPIVGGILITAALLLTGCATSTHPPLPGPSVGDVQVQNRENLNRLSTGMTREEIEALMGTETIQTYRYQKDRLNWRREVWVYKAVPYLKITQPHRTESLRASDGTQVEILYYYTDRKKLDDVISEDELTPLILEQGQLVGWGWSYLKQNVERYEIGIRTR